MPNQSGHAIFLLGSGMQNSKGFQQDNGLLNISFLSGLRKKEGHKFTFLTLKGLAFVSNKQQAGPVFYSALWNKPFKTVRKSHRAPPVKQPLCKICIFYTITQAPVLFSTKKPVCCNATHRRVLYKRDY